MKSLMGDLGQTWFAEGIVALAAGPVLLGATAAANAGDAGHSGVVTVSNGVTTVRLQNGLGGVAVYSGIPGTITVSNGSESRTLSGGTLTLSGDGHARGIQVDAPDADGDILVAVTPPQAPNAAQDIDLGTTMVLTNRPRDP